jgi:uncharacterized membrane-anchored protein YhcB (DUF1043 family)
MGAIMVSIWLFTVIGIGLVVGIFAVRANQQKSETKQQTEQKKLEYKQRRDEAIRIVALELAALRNARTALRDFVAQALRNFVAREIDADRTFLIRLQKQLSQAWYIGFLLTTMFAFLVYKLH